MSKSTLFSDFKVLDSIFSDAVNKFQENKQFAYLCSLLILNSNNLFTDPQSKLLYKHFNYDSDLVTILECLYEISETESEGAEENGLNHFTILSIYSQIEKEYDVKNGQMSVFQAINWAKSQQDGILCIINKFINCLNQSEFVDKRKCKFKYIYNASPESFPSLVYKTKDDKEIDIYRRPGCHGLQSPGNIIILSVHEDSINNKLHGILIHHDTSEKNENLGVVSVETYNNIFFFKLYEAYMDEEFFSDANFMKIYSSNIKDDQNALKIYINNNESKSFLSYCPLNSSVDNSIKSSIEFINSLIPFVPRSLLINFEEPNCVVEMNGYGTAINFTTSIYFDSTELLAYQINKETLEYAKANINELKKDSTKVRFALTGENFFIKEVSNENDINQQFSYPDVNESIKSIFDPNHASHLVLLVSNEYANKPDTLPLPFMPKEKTIYKQSFMHSKWNYNEFSFPLIKNDNDEENITCLYICDSSSFHQHPLFVYDKDGTTKEFKICLNCLKIIFEVMEEMNEVIDPTDKKILYDKIDHLFYIPGLPLVEIYEYMNNNSSWPQIPLGQLMFILLSVNDLELIKYVKMWFTIIINFTVIHSKCFIRCPNHPKIFHKKPKENRSFKCPFCDLSYCSKCQKWHLISDKCVDTDENIKRCPNCEIAIIKTSGTDHIVCHCGKHWCYKCSESPIFDTAQEYYRHYNAVHRVFDTDFAFT